MFAESFGSPYPATRLDVQRSYLEDKRAGYAFMNPDPCDDRETYPSKILRFIGEFVARAIATERRQTGQAVITASKPAGSSVDTAAPI